MAGTGRRQQCGLAANAIWRDLKEKLGNISGIPEIPEGETVLGEEGAFGAEFMPQSYSSSVILSK